LVEAWRTKQTADGGPPVDYGHCVSFDHHTRQFLAAILENAACVSPAWQPYLLAASVHYFHGTQTPDNPVIRHVHEALQHKG
jgi:hypothetical protein